jgi:hypothetical protein
LKKDPVVEDGIDGMPMNSESVTTHQSSVVTDQRGVTAVANMTSSVASDDDDDFKLSKPKGNQKSLN